MILWLPLAHRTQARALARAEAYAQAIDQDYQTPEKIYRFLCADFRARMSEADFCAAWEKERSYPYIPPLYLFWPEVTAYSAFVGYDVAVCAKTGTAQHGSGGSDNASFVLYAPADDPEIAIAIYVEKGAQGGTLGTIARDILTAYFSEAGSPDPVPAENTLN